MNDDAALLAWMRQRAAGRPAKPTAALACASLTHGATRADAAAYFLAPIFRVLYAGDTALHVAAAAYDVKAVQALLKLGADVHARNRRGATPLHSAAVGAPDAAFWNPRAQVAVIEALVRAGADPNAAEPDGATPLQRAVRTRCSAAVGALLRLGADARGTATLVRHNTGRGGSGSAAAKAELREIARLLGQTK